MAVLLLLIAVVVFSVAYVTYGRFLRDKVFELKEENPTPAHELRDGVDYVPAPAPVLLGHHFASIAGAGPIVGPIAAASAWGWLPAYLWILLGNIFIGGVHDFSSLVASVRNKARSIAQIGGMYFSKRASFLFKLFIWLALLYVVAVFINVAQVTFNTVWNGEHIGGGVATSAIIYIFLAIAFGISVYKFRINIKYATLLFVILVYITVFVGQKFPIVLPPKVWDVILIIYVAIASVTPVWILLQPRDYLSSFLLYGAVIGAGLGILLSFGKVEAHAPAFTGFDSELGSLFPLLFVVIACGSISGFHSLVGSGTTSKQLDKEPDALPVGYGAMLIEGIVAVMSVIFVLTLTKEQLKGGLAMAYGAGIGKFMSFLGIPESFGMAFGMLALSSFILTSTDTGTRLARYVFSELSGITNRTISTLVSLIIPAFLVFTTYKDPATGKVLPVWKALWPVFGATNQLIAGLSLFVVTLWLVKTGKKKFWFITGIPSAIMVVITITALMSLFFKWKISVVGISALVQVVLAVWVLFEGSLALKKFLKEESKVG